MTLKFLDDYDHWYFGLWQVNQSNETLQNFMPIK